MFYVQILVFNGNADQQQTETFLDVYNDSTVIVTLSALKKVKKKDELLQCAEIMDNVEAENAFCVQYFCVLVHFGMQSQTMVPTNKMVCYV